MVDKKDDEFHLDDDWEEGEFEEDVYTDEGIEKLEEADEIDEVEAGIAEGFKHGKHMVYCAECGKLLVGENFVEEEINGDTFRFCTKLCAMRYEEKQ